MGFERETDSRLARRADCYWQAPLPRRHDVVVYPSLPEPYLNLYFPVGCDAPALIKGLSSSADFLEMRCTLFGVRLHARAALYLDIVPWTRTTNRIQPISDVVGGHWLMEAASNVRRAASFPQRVSAFREILTRGLDSDVDTTWLQTADLVEYIVRHFQDKNVLADAAHFVGISRRSMGRWFSRLVGLRPKQLVQSARFHAASASLHAEKDAGFFLDCGFFDQSHFIREFRSVTGMSPEKYLSTLSRFYNTR